jgi:hypothetical protein
VPADIKGGYARILKARERLLEVRAERAARLLLLRDLLMKRFTPFMQTTDPVTGMRLADVAAEGSKLNGDLAIVLAFFEGTRFRVAVDVLARYTYDVAPEGVLPDLGELLDVQVSGSGSSATLICKTADGLEERHDVIELTGRLLEQAVVAIEAEVPPDRTSPPPDHTAPVT